MTNRTLLKNLNYRTINTSRDRVELLEAYTQISLLQATLAAACLQNGLRVIITVGADVRTLAPYIQFSIHYQDDDRAIFTGQARSAEEDFFVNILKLIRGEMVSELCPPAIRAAVPYTSDDGIFVSIAFWKRRLIVETDVTEMGSKKEEPDALSRVSRQAVWVGFSTLGAEIIRVPDGVANPNAADIQQVRHMEMGARGQCVVVIYPEQMLTLAQLNANAPEIAGTSAAVSASVAMSDAVATARANLAAGSNPNERTTPGKPRGVGTPLSNVLSSLHTPPLRDSRTKVEIVEGDCGNKETTSVEIKNARDHWSVIGKSYVDPVSGEVKTVTSEDKHLIGKTLKMRSVVHCVSPGNTICTACVGNVDRLSSGLGNDFKKLFTRAAEEPKSELREIKKKLQKIPALGRNPAVDRPMSIQIKKVTTTSTKPVTKAVKVVPKKPTKEMVAKTLAKSLPTPAKKAPPKKPSGRK